MSDTPEELGKRLNNLAVARANILSGLLTEATAQLTRTGNGLVEVGPFLHSLARTIDEVGSLIEEIAAEI